MCFVLAIMAALGFNQLHPAGQGTIEMDADDIGGTVRSSVGPESGVWVIAETQDFRAVYRKIVVTDEDGRYVLPDLPDAQYNIWVRGYGLNDSGKVNGRPGAMLDLTVEVAATPQDAAKVYPANYWYSLMEVPSPSEFPGTGPSGNGIAPGMQTQAHWVDTLKQGCQLCHQLGNQATREVSNPQDFDSTQAAWAHRIMTGQRGQTMGAYISRLGRDRGIESYADWTDRIVSGEVPEQPPRPEGRERDVVLTMWEWGGDTAYIHDEIASDKRNPHVNAGGPVYGVEFANDELVWVDPQTHESHAVALPVRDSPGEGDFESYMAQDMPNPSLYYGDELIWNNPGNPHNPMMDAHGRVWMTHQIRGPGNPSWCQEGSDNAFAQYYPLERAARHAAFFDPERESVELIDTCFNTHHLQFGFDDADTLYFSSVSDVVGWIDTKQYEQTGDEQASQGWCPTIVDTTGDGRIGQWTGYRDTPDPTKDRQMGRGWYGIVPDPTEDRVIWAAAGGVPGQIARLSLGDSPPETCITEYYQPPFDNPNSPVDGYSPRGIDIDQNGIVWTALSGSGHFAKFDRSQCQVLNGPTATGQHCPEGWTLYATPGPQMKGLRNNGSADFHYYNWVDQFDTLGLGENIPIATGSTSDSLLAFIPDSEEFVVMRVPYPLGFYSRGMDGRIDDPSTGWKGRGVWADYGTNAVWHIEGGKGTKSNLVKFQIRPNPLAH